MANDNQGNLLVNQGMSAPYGAAARTGLIYNCITATAFTPLVLIPTNAAKLELWNSSSGSSAFTMEILDLTAFQLLSTAASQTYAIWAQVSQPVPAGPTITALTVFSQSGGGSYSAAAGSGRVQTGINTTVVASGWRPWGNVQAWGTATATPGNAWSADVLGRLVVPPQCSLALTIVGALATASTFHVGASWIERPITTAPTLVA